MAGDAVVGDSRGSDRVERAQHLDLLVAHRGRVEVGRRLHRDQGEQLQHVVLDHVAKRAGALVIIDPPLQPDRLADGDLDMIDMRAVPQRLEHQIGKPQRQQILHRFLAEIMIDPENPVLGESRGDRVIDLAARSEVESQGLFEREPDIVRGKADCGKASDDRLEQARCGRQKDGEPRFVITDRLGEFGEASLIIDVERDIIEPGKESRCDFLVQEAIGQIFLERLAGEGAEAVGVEIRPRGADDIEIGREQPVGVEPVERRKQHAAGEIAGRAEHQESSGFVSHARRVTSER